MPEHDPRDAESPAPTTPRVSGEVPTSSPAVDTPQPESIRRPAQLPDEPSVASEPGDTLLSAGKPANRLDLVLDDRYAMLDDRLRQLDSRLAVLEQKKSIVPPEPRQKPWLWIAFLVAIVVIFQLLRWIR